MKKWIALLLVVVLCLSLAAGGSNKDTADTETVDETSSEQTKATEYAVGEAFGTDSVECVITEVRWVTLDDVTSHPAAHPVVGSTIKKELMAKDMFPEYSFFGISGFNDTMKGYPYLVVTFTLQNVGKTLVEPAIQGYEMKPYGNISVIYDDGYTFDAKEGFNATLEVLGASVKEGRIFEVPSQVSENEDKPLKVKVMLPNASGEAEEFIVSVR